MTPISSSSPTAVTLSGRVREVAHAGTADSLRPDTAVAFPRFTLETPSGDRIVSRGAVARLEHTGGDAFEAARRWLVALASGAQLDAPDRGSVEEHLVAIVLFPFDTCAEAGPAIPLHHAWIPAWVERADASGRVRSVEWSASDPPHTPHVTPVGASPPWTAEEWTRDAWHRAVDASLERIRSGALRKVVLSRSRVVRGEAAFDGERIFRALSEAYPECYRFRYESGDGSVFLGASPERLVALRRGRIEADAVAGTSADEGGSLLTDPKETLEHEITVDEIVAALRPVADRVDADPGPSTQRLRNVTHLRTRVRAAARPGSHVLDLAGRIHPSPAVAGSPRDAALERIRSLEPSARGWYAGPIGWASAGGDGEFTLGLRAARIRGREAFLRAGAGIVLGSDPDREWEECESKMRAMEEALRG